jgi:hypothetical protein
MATVTATVTYLLSEQGRRQSLRNGGDGRRVQQVQGSISDQDLDAFVVNDEGQVSFDLTHMHGLDPDFNPGVLLPATKGRFQDGALLWDIVPTWGDLVESVCAFKAETDDMQAADEAHQAKLERVAQQFMDDPSARATRLDKRAAIIGGEQFYGDLAVIVEARRRADFDIEEARKKNRATLAEWVEQHGTENQRQRLSAGLLPWKEAFDAVEDYLFKPTSSFPLYEKFDIGDICMCLSRVEGQTCSPKFQSVDAAELTADEWEQFAAIKTAVEGAQFQLREHRAQCESATEAQMRRGVIVKFSLGQLTFKREFALTLDQDVPF